MRMLQNIPNILTVTRILLTPVFGYFLLQNSYPSRWIAIGLFFIASVTDWYDGYFARKYNFTTRLGQFLDPIADKVLVSTALIIYAQVNYIYWWMVIVIILRDVIVTGLRMYALSHGKSIITSSFAKWKTFIQMGYIFFLMVYLAIPNLPDLHLQHNMADIYNGSIIVASIVVFLTIFSGIHYLYYNRSHVSEIFIRLFRRLF